MNSALARSGLVALGCTLACGNDAREAERLRTAGGETTEFSGDVAACPEIVSSTPIDRADPRVAPWVALAEGRREVSLRWEREFVSDAVTGFEEHTSATFDVRVVGVADVTYGAGGSAEHEDVCAGRVERHFELELDLTTADGALAGTLQYYAQPTGDADEPSTLQLVDANLRLDNGRYALDELGGALELGAPYAGAVVGFWSASFTFDAGALRGIVRPLVGADERSLWSPVSARFPDDGCSPLQPLSLDEPSAALGESPRQAHQRLRALIAADSAPARWAPPRGAGAAPELDDTEVTLGLGEATHACLAYGDTVYVNAPLTLTSADGRVDVTRSAQIGFYPAERASLEARSPWIEASAFEAAGGVRDVPLPAGSYGSVIVSVALDGGEDRVEGTLDVLSWVDGEEAFAEHPRLEWCRGEGCGGLVDPGLRE